MTVEGYSNSEWRAGAAAEGSYTPTQLFTAEDEIKTSAGLVKSGQILAVLTIVAYDADNELVPWDPTDVADVVGGAVDQTEAGPESFPVGILAADMNTGNTDGGYNADTFSPYYCGGCFNPDLLVWPASLDTYQKREAALARHRAPFRVKRLL